MDTTRAVEALSALAHAGRLALVRTLIQAGPGGVPAGELAASAGIGATTASAQLLVLRNAGLVEAQRQGRQVVYTAHYDAMTALLGYLMQDCCGGCSDICQPLKAAL